MCAAAVLAGCSLFTSFDGLGGAGGDAGVDAGDDASSVDAASDDATPPSDVADVGPLAFAPQPGRYKYAGDGGDQLTGVEHGTLPYDAVTFDPEIAGRLTYTAADTWQLSLALRPSTTFPNDAGLDVASAGTTAVFAFRSDARALYAAAEHVHDVWQWNIYGVSPFRENRVRSCAAGTEVLDVDAALGAGWTQACTGTDNLTTQQFAYGSHETLVTVEPVGVAGAFVSAYHVRSSRELTGPSIPDSDGGVETGNVWYATTNGLPLVVDWQLDVHELTSDGGVARRTTSLHYVVEGTTPDPLDAGADGD